MAEQSFPFDDEDITIPDAREPATEESVLRFIEAFCRAMNVDGDGWANFRQGLLTFATDEINGFPGGPANCRVGDIVPRIWAYYKGYMTCTTYTNRELQQLSERLHKLINSRQGPRGANPLDA